MSCSRDARWNRRRFLRTASAGTVGLWQSQGLFRGTLDAASPSLLYNGIRLSDPWPPRYRSLPAALVTPPYLVAPPAVIPIDLGRQLFVDDFLIEETSLSRTFHRAEYQAGNPILQPTEEWEKFDEYAVRTKTRPNPAAMPFSDGVFYDPHDRLFKMWYMGGYSQNTCYAVSHDGVAWEKPALDVVPGTNIVTHGRRDSSTVWLDLDERDRSRRCKMAHWYDHYMVLSASADGIHWREIGRTGLTGDRTTFFYNPFRRVWVYSLRGESTPGGIGRHRRYWETPDLFANVGWQTDEPPMWIGADADDPRRLDLDLPCELYNLDCVAYESIVLGLFTIFRGERTEREKPNDLCVGFSRDGFHWSRPDRRPFLTVGTRRRVELGQRAVGRRLLSRRRRRAAFLRQRPARLARHQRPGHLQHRSGDAAPRRVRLDGRRRRDVDRRARGAGSTAGDAHDEAGAVHRPAAVRERRCAGRRAARGTARRQ
ncbi:MAG TPA: hypothetical protein VNG89_24665, partial [Vicinamibacterales bacterium]|nr:hypothetical protein [Vicinamibacterales bacterium]